MTEGRAKDISWGLQKGQKTQCLPNISQPKVDEVKTLEAGKLWDIGLNVNIKKTNSMRIKNSTFNRSFRVYKEEIYEVVVCTYVGSTVTITGGAVKVVLVCIRKVNTVLLCMDLT